MSDLKPCAWCKRPVFGRFITRLDKDSGELVDLCPSEESACDKRWVQAKEKAKASGQGSLF